MIKKYWWIVVAILLRILLGAVLYHPDVKTINQEVKFLSSGISRAYEESLKQGVEMHYPPPVYLIFQWHQAINGWMFSDYYDTWLSDGGILQTVNHKQIFRDLIAMKVPMMVMDMAIAWMLYRGLEIGKKRLGVMLWLFNPVSLYAIYGVGNFDVLAVGLLMGAWWSWRKNVRWLSYLLLGLAGGLKLFALLLVPMVWIQRQTFKDRLVGLLSVIIGFGLCLVPIWNSKVAIKSIFLSNLTSGIFQSRIEFNSTHYVSIFLIIYFAIWWWIWNKRNDIGLAQIVYVVLAPLFAFSHFHPQWMVWLMPFMIILYLEGRLSGRLWALIIGAYFVVVGLIADKFVGLGMLKALNNGFDSLQSLRWILDRVGIGGQLQGVFHSALSAFLLMGIWEMFSKSNNRIKFNRWLQPRVVVSLVIGSLGVVGICAYGLLSVWGMNVDKSVGTAIQSVWLYPSVVVEQVIVPTKEVPVVLELRFKNVNMEFDGELMVEWEQGGQIKMGEKIRGVSIGDDYNLGLVIPKEIVANQELRVKLSIDGGDGKRLAVVADPSLQGLMVNGEEVNAGLVYTLYYRGW